MPRIEPVAAGCEAQMQPMCYTIPTSKQFSVAFAERYGIYFKLAVELESGSAYYESRRPRDLGGLEDLGDPVHATKV